MAGTERLLVERCAAIVGIATLAIGLVGCSEDVHVDLAPLPGPPGSSLQGDNMTVAPGTALIVNAQPKESDGDVADATVEIVAAPPFEVAKTTKKNRFVIVATSSGKAKLRVVVNGEDVRTINADAP
jgi:hypothetical protein